MTFNRFEVTKNLCEKQIIVVYLRLLLVILAQLNNLNSWSVVNVTRHELCPAHV